MNSLDNHIKNPDADNSWFKSLDFKNLNLGKKQLCLASQENHNRFQKSI
jgi:hypothetical protein